MRERTENIQTVPYSIVKYFTVLDFWANQKRHKTRLSTILAKTGKRLAYP